MLIFVLCFESDSYMETKILKRRKSTVAHVGGLAIGGENPIRIQSMATVDTNDTEGCVAQAKRIIDAGGELVRFTTQGTREALNMEHISRRLKEDGYMQPLVADVHFNANVADVAARYCEKVRINPGNYVDPARTFKHLEYTDEEYAAELQRLDKRLVTFINICKEHHTAVRIGVNHGSLSDRIMSRYGDTPAGIVESCMEFLRIFKREAFDDVVISIKASNTVVMVQSVRLLVQQMDKEDMHYPLHLGVTEAGEGEDGRIKSAVGIGALLTEGIGDTIRVSLSEEPEAEIPVARKLVELTKSLPLSASKGSEDSECMYIEGDTLHLRLEAPDWETFQLKAAMAAGSVLIDRKATKLKIEVRGEKPLGFAAWLVQEGVSKGQERLTALADAILQAARIKFTKTEYISCPGCGRTLYNLQETIARIKAATSHLVGVKIGIMGCIVNGPGEMADADYGYVGAGRGKISLYRGKECIEKNIPEEEAVQKLLDFIEKDRRESKIQVKYK